MRIIVKRKHPLIVQKAFTLIEMLLTVCLMTLISATLFNFFYMGKKVYSRVHKLNQQVTSYENCFHIVQRDILNMIEWQNCFMVLNANHLYFYVKDN